MISPLVYCMKMKSTCSSLFLFSISSQFPLNTPLYIDSKSFFLPQSQKKKKKPIDRLLLRISQLFFLSLRNSHTYTYIYIRKNPDRRFIPIYIYGSVLIVFGRYFIRSHYRRYSYASWRRFTGIYASFVFFTDLYIFKKFKSVYPSMEIFSISLFRTHIYL